MAVPRIAIKERWIEGNEPNNVAISLSGEPTFYPYLPELIEEYEKRGFTTFLVTNGTIPEMLAKVSPSQLYMSLDAPDLETYLKVCQPKSACTLGKNQRISVPDEAEKIKDSHPDNAGQG